MALGDRWTLFASFPKALKIFPEKTEKINLIIKLHKNNGTSPFLYFQGEIQKILTFRRGP